jgi:hypothetical protein
MHVFFIPGEYIYGERKRESERVELCIYIYFAELYTLIKAVKEKNIKENEQKRSYYGEKDKLTKPQQVVWKLLMCTYLISANFFELWNISSGKTLAGSPQ